MKDVDNPKVNDVNIYAPSQVRGAHKTTGIVSKFVRMPSVFKYSRSHAVGCKTVRMPSKADHDNSHLDP